jgi:zinc protease
MNKLMIAMLCAGLLSPATILAAPARKPVKPAPVKKPDPASIVVAPAVPVPPPLPAPVKGASMAGITEYRLVNGLQVLLLPDASKPVITTNLVYLVGSRHEGYGQTGMAHLLEHMTFLRTANYGAAEGSRRPADILASMGGRFNGFTNHDSTNYIATFPASPENLRQMLELEADRMLNATIRQDDLWNAAEGRGEMSVVRNEFERAESDPSRVLFQRIRAVAHDWHNYGNAIIGSRHDIENVSASALRQFYQTYYQPDNAVLVISGKFDEAQALSDVNRIFGAMPKPTRTITPTYTAEPVQDGERTATVRRNGGAAMVAVGYHFPPSSHPETVALNVLERILVDSPGGRLSRAVAALRQGANLTIGSPTSKESAYNIFGATMPKEGNVDLVQATLIKELEGLKDKPVTDDEVNRVRQAIKASLTRSTSESAAIPALLTSAIASGDWRLFYWHIDLLEKLDAKAVQAVAVKYFKPANRTVGRFLPTDAPDRAEMPPAVDLATALNAFKGPEAAAAVEAFDTAPLQIESRLQYFTLANGMKGALLAKPTKNQTVSVAIRLRMGSEQALWGKARTATLTGALLSHGTQRLNRLQLKEAFEKINTRINVAPGVGGTTLTLSTDRNNLAAALDLAAEMLMKPALSESEFRSLRSFQINAMERVVPEPDFQSSYAYRLMLNAVKEGHPFYAGTVEHTIAEARAVKIEDIRAFHKAFYGAGNASISAVGDFDAAAVQAQVDKLFGQWTAEQAYARIEVSSTPEPGGRKVVQTPDKQNSTINAGHHVALGETSKDYPAMVLADHLLGGRGSSRLRDRIRTHEGLSYTVTTSLDVSSLREHGIWGVRAISAPQNLARVETLIREELARAARDGFTEAELVEAKKSWLQGQATSRASDSALASMLNENLGLARTMAVQHELEAKLAGLTAAEVTAAMRKYIDPSRLSVAMAGDFAKHSTPAPAGGAK